MLPYEPDVHDSRWRRGFLVPLLFLGLALVTNALPNGAQEQVSSALRSTVLAPFLWIQSSIHDAGVLTVDLERLQARLDSVQALLLGQSTLEQENRSLRGLLDLRTRGGPRFTPASVIRSGTLGSESMFILDVGALDGVSDNDAVVSPDGLLGTIRGVTSRTSVAMDWTHPDFRASAMTPGGEVLGVVEPSRGSFREEDRLVFRGVPYHTDVEVGTPVVTSGVGAVYPRGIPLGVVEGLAETEAGWARSYFLRPAARPGSETHVLVLSREGGTEADLAEEALGIENLFGPAPDSRTRLGPVRKSPALWAVAILLPVLHFVLHVGLGFGSEAADLLTIGLLVTARHVRTGTAAGLGFAFGLIEDALSTLSFGANATALTVVGLLGARSRDLFMGESLVFLTSYLALGVWTRMTLHWLMAGEALWSDAPRALLMEAPLEALYAAVVGTIFVWVTGAWEREPVR